MPNRALSMSILRTAVVLYALVAALAGFGMRHAAAAVQDSHLFSVMLQETSGDGVVPICGSKISLKNEGSKSGSKRRSGGCDGTSCEACSKKDPVKVSLSRTAGPSPLIPAATHSRVGPGVLPNWRSACTNARARAPPAAIRLA